MIDTISERDYLLELSSAVSCYLSLLSAVGNCVGLATPEVGELYKKRIGQLRTRVYFQATPKAIKSSLKVMEEELSDYAAVASQYLDQHNMELRRTIVVLEQTMDKLAAVQAFHGAQMQDLAARMEASESTERSSPSAVAGELQEAVASMHREFDATLDHVRSEITGVDERLRGNGSTDPSTGLLNAREMERQMEAYQTGGVLFSMVRFELYGAVTETVMKQAAGKIEKQFRHRDRVARWSDTEFLVLFQGSPEAAAARGVQVAELLTGPYSLTTGGQVEIFVQSLLADQEVSLA